MKKILSIAAAVLFACFSLAAQNDKADNIIGKYSSVQGEDGYKVNFFKAADGTYTAQIYWLANPYNKDGQFNYGWCITYDGSDYGAILLTHINKIKAMK